MNIDEFIRSNKCQKLYHMSEKGSWPLIQKMGLLSTSALLDISGYAGKERFEIESKLRETKKQINNPELGILYARDQIPMKDQPQRGIFLENLLDGIGKQQWFEFLNRKVFFWISKEELIKMICAWQYKGKPQWVITIDARTLLERYADIAHVSDQNTGSLYSRKKRGPKSFIPFRSCPLSTNIKELTVEYKIPDFSDYVISVDECVGNKVNEERVFMEIEHIWP